METKGLIFIPDISGFTRFVNATEIHHSRLIIQELLEVILNSNEIGLEVSEIEGDAILFYRFGNPPNLGEVYKQVEKMFCEFHKSLIAYEDQRYCWCEACRSAIHLTLKVISHYGEFAGYSVKEFHKLIGRDVIVAHQLLKNEIELHEYWLVTNTLLQDSEPQKYAQWMKWKSSTKATAGGELTFQYTQLSQLKENIVPPPSSGISLAALTKLFSVRKEYPSDIIRLFHATGDFNYRSRWMEGVAAVEDVTHSLPRVGMQCKCIMNEREEIIRSSSYAATPERVEFAETYANNSILLNYILEKTGEERTTLTIDYYSLRASSGTTESAENQKAETAMIHSLDNLSELVEEMVHGKSS